MYKDTVKIIFKILIALAILSSAGYGLVKLIPFITKKIEEQKQQQE